MANLSSKTGFTPVQTQVSIPTLNVATSVQDFAAYDAQVLTGFVYVDATADLRCSVSVTVVKNGAGVYEVASVDLAGDNYASAPMVSFSMSGSILRATLPAGIPGFASAYIKYQLNAPALGGQFPLTVDGSNVTPASATAQGSVTTGAQTFAGVKTFTGAVKLSVPSGVSEGGQLEFYSKDTTTLRTMIDIDGSDNTRFFTSGSYAQTFSNNGTERMRVHTNGNIGIGTLSPGSRLTVAGGNMEVFYTAGAGNTNYQKFEHYGSTIVFHNISSNTNYDIVNFNNGVRLAVNGTSWGAISDERKKKNIQSLEYGLSEIEALRPVRFDYKTEETDNSARVGFIAQELAPVIKEAVQGSEDTEYSVTSSDLIPVLVKAIQELSAKVDAQAAKIAELEAR